MRAFPYFIPVFLTSVFICTVYTGLFWLGPLLLPAAGLLSKKAGRFSQRQLLDEYAYFHHSPAMRWVKSVNGLFFTGFNSWVFLYLCFHDLNTLSFLLFVYSVIIINSNFSVSLAHELMHSERSSGRIMATVILLLNGFFYLEADHIHIHHRHVATKEDPASARLGEALYPYLLRSVSQRLRIIFGYSNHRLPVLKHNIVRSSILKAFICLSFLGLCFFIKKQVFSWILLQYIFVTLLYEVITYIQHYGLRRKEGARAAEPVAMRHSWNCNYRLSAYMHFMMPVHSIHHLKTEPDLDRLEDTGPLYPYPFAKMVISAFIPAYWFRVMNERVLFINKRSGAAHEKR